MTYEAGELRIDGELQLDIADGTAQLAARIAYRGLEKELGAVYANGGIYLTIDGIKVRANVAEAAELLVGLIGTGEGSAESDLLEKVLGLTFGEVIGLDGTEESTQIVIKGTELLKALGVEFALGDVTVTVREGEVTVAALGADITVTAGEAFTADTEGYTDITVVLKELFTILSERRIGLSGMLALRYGDMQMSLTVENGILSWESGVVVSLRLKIAVNGIEQLIRVYADETLVKIAYGNVGAELVYAELSSIAQAFETVRDRVLAVLSDVTGDTAESAEALSDLLAGGNAVTQAIDAFDFATLLQGLVLGGATQAPGSVATVAYGDLLAMELFDRTASGGTLGLALTLTSGDISLSGELVAAATSAQPDEPVGDYMTAEDFCDLLDLVGAAVGTISSPDVSVSFRNGTTVYTADGSEKFTIDGLVVYHSGEAGLPIHIDTETTTLTVNPDCYVYVALRLDEISEAGTDLYFDFWMLDADDDGELDFYIDISKYAATDSRYQPLRFSLSSGDLFTILSAGLSLVGPEEGVLNDFLTGVVGLDEATVAALAGVLNDYLISDWLTATDKAQLEAVGSVFMKSLGIEAAIQELLAQLGGAMTMGDAVNPGEYVTELGFVRDEAAGTATFTLALNSDLIFGGTQLSDLTISITKRGAIGESVLTGIALSNIYGNGASEKTTVDFAFSYAQIPLTAKDGGIVLNIDDSIRPVLTFADYSDYTFAGVDELLKAIARSATHETADGAYALNENYYISGSMSGKIGSWSLTDIGVSLGVNVDAAGEVTINLKLTYRSFPLVIDSSGTTELTIRNGMVWMKRTLEGEQPTYRVMPLSNFFSGILTDHLGYMLAFSDTINGTIRDALNKQPADGGEPAVNTDDYGIVLGNILKSYAYSGAESGAQWKLVLNGQALTDGVLGDMTVELGAGADGVLRTLGFNAGLYTILTLDADLFYRNPCNVWESGEAQAAFEAMDDLSDNFASVECDWAEQDGAYYLAGKLTSVKFVVAGNTISVQNVLYDPASGEAYSVVTLPDLSQWQRDGYTVAWSKTDFSQIKENESVHALYTPNTYTLTLVSERAAEGFVYDPASGAWIRTVEYTYGDLSLPFVADAERYIASYSAEGYLLTADSDGLNILSDLTLNADWAWFEYTVEFVADGVVVATQTAHYGDALQPPAAPEKPGYAFAGWGLTGETVTGNASYTAVYTPNVYTVTLQSAYPIEGFVFDPASGLYEQTCTRVYGTALVLPAAVTYEGRFLDGFVYNGTLYTQAPDAAEDMLLTAQWSMLGYEVVFVAEGETVLVQNYHYGDLLVPPAVPEKFGYTGAWQVREGQTVTDNMRIDVVYTANAYTVTLISGLPAEGYTFDELAGAYVKEVVYVYDDAPVALDPAVKVPCYDFGGYYTLPEGAGTAVTQLDNAIVPACAVYLLWIDNTVTINLLSDLALEGSAFNPAKNGYERQLSFNDDYALTYRPSVEGYRLLAWFALQNGAWNIVTDVRGLNGADVVALWISEMQVTFTNVSKTDIWVGYTYNIEGEVRGGDVYGVLSEAIAGAVSLDVTTEGFYRIYGSDGGSDNLKYGEVFELNYNSEGAAPFSATGMTSGKYGTKFTKPAVSGGVVITKTFRCGDAVVTVEIEASAPIV